ncbi:probable membrane-associated kinase regulator 6 [Actinidia eriantha]|uniref:probable membrane-associated kinase regulator 6 n=1 Tax=Actinidia eriantha TaxID=165200 RepID=UPI002588A9D3|nr:probable membrane-associated kinase regulator 6 [Actinidia eriantha]
MEISQALSIESFSYSWLTNRNFSSDSPSEPLRPSLDFSYEATYEETKYRRVRSKRNEEEAHNLNFDFPISKSPAVLVHADEIFSGGHILPKYGDQSNTEAVNPSNSVLSLPMSSISLRTVCPEDRIRFHFLKRWRKSSKRILQKYLGFFGPLCQKVGCPRRSIRVDDIDRKVWEVREVKRNSSPQASPPRGTTSYAGNWGHIKRQGTKTADTMRKVKSWSNSPQGSPGRSPSYFSDDWSIDSSIHEAILHCKRSFEK